MERICIGVVTKPQALKGQFRVKPYLLNLKQYKKLNEVEIGASLYQVESVVLRDTFVIFKVQGIDSCEKAESFRNKEIYAEIEESQESHFDLQGYMVIVDSEQIGHIQEINNYGSKDIVSIVGKRNLMLPIIDDLIESIDKDKKVVIINKNIFDQVAVYED